MEKDNLISSVNNKKIIDLIKIRDNKLKKNDTKLFFLEGERLINDSPIDLIDSIFVVCGYKNSLDRFKNCNIYYLTEQVYNKVKDTKNSQGIIALAKKCIKFNCIDLFKNNINNIVFLDNINDPGNLGTIFRTCEASGLINVVITNDCCNLFMPKVLRASMSSIFRINIFQIDNVSYFINKAKDYQYKIISTTMFNSINYFDYDFKNNKNIIVFGNEALGIRKEILNASDVSLSIPMDGNIESLNVAISFAIISYEIRKQINYEIR